MTIHAQELLQIFLCKHINFCDLIEINKVLHFAKQGQFGVLLKNGEHQNLQNAQSFVEFC